MPTIIGRLKLERFDKDFRLLERREQPMRSWTVGLMNILYVSHAQILPAAPFTCLGDINNTTRTMSIEATWGSAGYRYMISHGRVAALPGFATLASVNSYDAGNDGMVQGCDIGIQIGNDNTPVDARNLRMGRRIGHGVRAADAGDATFEAYDVNDDASQNIITNDNCQLAQAFCPQNDFRCSSVELKLFKTLAPAGPLTVEIRAPENAVSGVTQIKPTTTVLATGTILSAAIGASPGAFVACNFGTPFDCYAGHKYFIVCHSAGVDGANYFSWRHDTAGALYDRAIYSTTYNHVNFRARTLDAWVTSSSDVDSDYMFRTIGRSIGEMEYGGCEVVHRVTADPNDAFDIRRFFYNRSGGAITVNEVGIAAQFKSYSSVAGARKTLPMLIARDVVAGVAVANNEILLATYTPSIAV